MAKDCQVGPSAMEHHMKSPKDRDALVNSVSPGDLSFHKVSPFSGLSSFWMQLGNRWDVTATSLTSLIINCLNFINYFTVLSHLLQR